MQSYPEIPLLGLYTTENYYLHEYLKMYVEGCSPQYYLLLKKLRTGDRVGVSHGEKGGTTVTKQQ